MSKTLCIAVFLASFLLVNGSSVLAQRRSDEVDSDQRLQLLRQATGSSSAPAGTFQARLDAIMDTSASAERLTVAMDDQQERQRIQALEQQELLEEELEKQKPNPASMKKQDQTKIANAVVKLKEDHSEAAFQKTRDEISSDFDKRIQKAAETKKTAETQRAAEDESSLPPSLANNPFYFSSEKRESLFKERKAILVSRLMGASDISAEDAESLVSQSSSYEELILQLMQEYNLTYGEASDIVS